MDATIELDDVDDATATELEVQRWSMERPGFREGVERLRQRRS
jgi:hypothetical protein